jgi:hypothetical protein
MRCNRRSRMRSAYLAIVCTPLGGPYPLKAPRRQEPPPARRGREVAWSETGHAVWCVRVAGNGLVHGGADSVEVAVGYVPCILGRSVVVGGC